MKPTYGIIDDPNKRDDKVEDERYTGAISCSGSRRETVPSAWDQISEFERKRGEMERKLREIEAVYKKLKRGIQELRTTYPTHGSGLEREISLPDQDETVTLFDGSEHDSLLGDKDYVKHTITNCFHQWLRSRNQDRAVTSVPGPRSPPSQGNGLEQETSPSNQDETETLFDGSEHDTLFGDKDYVKHTIENFFLQWLRPRYPGRAVTSAHGPRGMSRKEEKNIVYCARNAWLAEHRITTQAKQRRAKEAAQSRNQIMLDDGDFEFLGQQFEKEPEIKTSIPSTLVRRRLTFPFSGREVWECSIIKRGESGPIVSRPSSMIVVL